jgi:DNA-binding transcriptional ArsR family regulator
MAKKEEGARPPDGLEQIRALAHPLRLRLLELFAERPRTTKQAAQALGEAPTRLYHHVAALEKAGLVRLRETRQNRGTTEKYFETTQDRFMAKADPAALLQDEATQAAVGFMVFDQAREELLRALSSTPSPRSLMAVRGILSLSKTEAKRLRKELVELFKRVSDRPDEQGRPSRTKRRRYTLTIALLPADRESDGAT